LSTPPEGKYFGILAIYSNSELKCGYWVKPSAAAVCLGYPNGVGQFF